MPIIYGGSDQLQSSTYFGHDAHFKLLLCRSFYAVDKRCEILFIFFFDANHGNFMYKIIKIWISKRTLKCFVFQGRKDNLIPERAVYFLGIRKLKIVLHIELAFL